MLDKLLDQLSSVDTRLADKAWCDHLYLQNFSSFFHRLVPVLGIIETAHRECNRYIDDNGNNVRAIECCQVKRCHGILYAVAMSTIRYLSPHLPNTRDEYANCPLTIIYGGIATCTLFLQEFFPYDDVSYFHKKQRDIPFCLENSLNIVMDATIDEFSLQELIYSMCHLEQSVHTLHYLPDIQQYVDALDLRVCTFLLNALPASSHNVESLRVLHGDDLYTCTTSCEYHLVTLILSLRQLVESAVPAIRTNPPLSIRSEEDIGNIKQIYLMFIKEIKSVYGDSIADKFYKLYTQESIARSEGYLFLKSNPMAKKVTAESTIRQFRNIPQWRAIAEDASRFLYHYLVDTSLPFLGFKLVFNLVLDLIFNQTVKTPWLSFCTTGETIRNMDMAEYKTFVETSYITPFFVVLLNDACIFYKNQLYIYGRQREDYYFTLIQWMNIISCERGGRVGKWGSVDVLRSFLYDRNSTIGVDDTINDPVEESELEEMVRKKIFSRKEIAYREYQTIISRTETRQQEVDASNTIGDIDERGLPSTSHSAW